MSDWRKLTLEQKIAEVAAVYGVTVQRPAAKTCMVFLVVYGLTQADSVTVATLMSANPGAEVFPLDKGRILALFESPPNMTVKSVVG